MAESLTEAPRKWPHQRMAVTRNVDDPKLAARILANDVFGEDHKKDRKGRPIPQGKGSAAQPTRQHLEAMKKHYREHARDMSDEEKKEWNDAISATTAALKAREAEADADE